jgi:hypothetical protein
MKVRNYGRMGDGVAQVLRIVHAFSEIPPSLESSGHGLPFAGFESRL